ncbi:hypothetical protein N7468_000090 [Penicillium chermesinum]|uniref:Small nuclear ribonucleoprotein Prp3 C-terminal domain-containing protein n=1 Tax=Penicillium chermesinum TaxID=63820 RepID=A0A9W9PKY9_9EURO|nr:uncharacterized protein N7468_000090 [Penicillium chermesinum]KAJ5248639.1 hypothetical protein N7468_000090 [Penicillium chermesinum]KAJ6150749.1 hypothetical protein N7470_007343 [Penicillium chermesinum]
MANSKKALPMDMIEAQLSTFDLLAAMFPSPGELEIPEATTQGVERLRDWCQGDCAPPSQIPSSLYVVVSLPIQDGERYIQVSVAIPLECDDPEILDDPPPLSYSLRQPDWLSKAEVTAVATSIPRTDALDAFDYIQAEVSRVLAEKQRQLSRQPVPQSNSGPTVRVWFYFPSLSTRKKRDDMVNLAPGYSLSGFVLAGKPGVLCLEGRSADIDAYMSFIKTHSWGDIPSHQKKVSERYRETDIQRVFPGMEEITDSLGERGGQRANRGDMQALEAWLAAKGLQKAFEQVIF